MKKIRIFLASSIVEFANERMIIENFIRNISDQFEEHYNIKVQPLLCENLDDAYTKVRKQKEYNQQIRESDFCFFIFFTRVGQYTREEFLVAKEQFEKSGKPKIYTYFKVVEEGKAEQSLYDFMEELDKVFGHYYGTFSHIDTIKLRILLSLKLQEMDFLEIRVDGGKCIVDGTALMNVENVSEFANNDQLIKLQQDLEQVEEEYYSLKPQYEKEGNDPAFFSRYSKVASKRQALLDEIEELQDLIFQVSLHMAQDSIRGEISAKQKKAYALFEKGDYEGCLSVLNAEDIDNDFARNRKRLKEQELAVCRKYIREHKTAIEILETMKRYANRFHEIEDRYEKIIPVILEMKIELDTALGYVWYLIAQNEDRQALRLAETLVGEFPTLCEDASFLGVRAGLYARLNSPVEAEIDYRRAIEIQKRLAQEAPDSFLPKLAASYNGAGNFYSEQRQPAIAKDYYGKAIALWEKLAQENPDRYLPELALIYNNTGVFYSHQGQTVRAEDYYRQAIEVQKKLVQEDPDRFLPDLATSYTNIGVFYHKQEQADKAEDYSLKSIGIWERLAQENPGRFLPKLAAGYYNTGVIYFNQRQPANAEKFYRRAIEIREKLARENPDRFLPDLAKTYNGIANLYSDQRKAVEAENYYGKAIALWEKLAQKNPTRFLPELALGYSNYAILRRDERLYQKALTLAERKPDDPICKQIIAKLKRDY